MNDASPWTRRIADLSDGEQREASAVVAAVHHAFAGRADRPGSEYYQAPGTTPEATWAAITEGLARAAALAVVAGRRDVGLAVEDVATIHRAIFAPVFGDVVTGFRGRRENVEYPIVLGTEQQPVPRTARGAGHRQIESRLASALEDFKHEAKAIRRGPASLRPAVHAAAKLYVRVIRIHPFLDGNGRTAWVIFVWALARLDLPLIALAPNDSTRWALGTALRSDAKHSFDPLVDLIVDAIRASARDT